MSAYLRYARMPAAAMRYLFGAKFYRAMLELVRPDLRYDEVSVVCHAIGATRANHGLMLDVGGHHGESAELFLSQGWKVHCFEPDRRNWGIIKRRIRRYNRRFELFPIALGEVESNGQTLYTSDESSGITSLHPFHESHQASSPVIVSTLAEHCAANGVSSIDFLKVDTEGFDLFVLRGHDWRVRPDVIVCEFEDRKTEALGYTFHDMASYLSGLGYRVIVSEWNPVVRYGGRHQWLRYARYPCELTSPLAWGNLIAIGNSDDETRIIERLNAVSSRSRDRIE